MRKQWSLIVALGLLTACQSGVPVVSSLVPAASFSVDVASFEQAVADSPVVDWSSNTFASKRLLELREARGRRMAGYKVAYAGWSGAPAWTRTHVGVAASNAVAYIASDPFNNMGPLPMPGDRLAYITNALKGTKNLFVLDPVTGNPLNGTGWDVLTTVGAPAGSQVDNSALTVSTKGTQAMFVTTGGYFGAVNLGTGAKTAGFALGASQQTYRSAPFINNSMYPGLDGDLEVWCATTNAGGGVGQLHKLTYHSALGTPWAYSGALTVRGAAADGTAGTVTAAGFKTSPVAWMGKVYIGDVAGRLWEYTIANGNARYWDMSPFTGLGTDQILAPVAIDIDNVGVTDVFVACGARVFWIDPIANTMTPSQQLLVDTATSTPGPKRQGSLAGYAFAGTDLAPLQASDSVSAGPSGSGFTNDGDSFGNEIVGSQHLNPGDNKPVTGYLRFDIPANYFGGKLPVASTLTMTIDNYTVNDTSDAGSIYRASTYLKNTSGQDTTTTWTSNNMSDRNQPRLLVPNPFSQRNGPVRPDGTPYDWNVNGAVPRDNATYSFAMRGTNKIYYGNQGTTGAPGYYGAFYGRTTAQKARRPKLTVKVANTGLGGAILSQPILLSLSPNPKLYVANSNAFFELDYTDNGRFGNAAQTYFSLTAGGRGGAGNLGVIDAGAKFVQNKVTTSVGVDGTGYCAFVSDENGVGIPHLAKYRLPLDRTANADSLLNVMNLPLASLRTTPYITWDYYGGSLYFATQGATSTLYRVPQ